MAAVYLTLALQAAYVPFWSSGSAQQLASLMPGSPLRRAGASSRTGLARLAAAAEPFEVGPVGAGRLGRRTTRLDFTCKACDTRTTRYINPEAYKKGVCIVQCANPECGKRHGARARRARRSLRRRCLTLALPATHPASTQPAGPRVPVVPSDFAPHCLQPDRRTSRARCARARSSGAAVRSLACAVPSARRVALGVQ
jgi:hypothetical protein